MDRFLFFCNRKRLLRGCFDRYNGLFVPIKIVIYRNAVPIIHLLNCDILDRSTQKTVSSRDGDLSFIFFAK